METKGIYIGETVKFGWKTMKSNLLFFIGILLLSWIVVAVPQIIAGLVIEKVVFLGLIFYIVYIILYCVVSMGLMKISLKFCDNEKGTIGDLFSCFHLFFKYLLSSILFILIIFGGMILLIFPAVIWGIKFCLYPYFIVEKGMGPVEALKASSRTTMGAKWELLGFGFVVGVINTIGVLCLLIGLFATVPITLVAVALVYRKLLSQTETVQSPTEAAGAIQ